VQGGLARVGIRQYGGGEDVAFAASEDEPAFARGQALLTPDETDLAVSVGNGVPEGLDVVRGAL